jgi:transposase
MLEETCDRDQIIQRVAALDVGKAELTCCVRVPGQSGSDRRLQEVRTYQTMTRRLLVMADRLAELGVTWVVMEATSDYWKGVCYLLEAAGFEVWLVNARDVKHLPGRPKTDTLDAVWRCKLAERQMLRPSFVPPRPIRQLREVTRYRADLVAARTAEKQRVEKLLEDAQINRSVVVSDIFGVSGRAMLAALLAGERDPKVLAQLARARLRAKLGPLAEAFTGFFTDQHAFLLAKMLARVDALDTDLADLDTKLAELIAPFTRAVDRLDEIPGLGQLAAYLLIAELGLDMTRFPTAGHLVSWAKFAPGVSESAGNPKGRGSTGHGNPYLARVLGEAAVAASKTDTFLGERYRRMMASPGHHGDRRTPRLHPPNSGTPGSNAYTRTATISMSMATGQASGQPYGQSAVQPSWANRASGRWPSMRRRTWGVHQASRLAWSRPQGHCCNGRSPGMSAIQVVSLTSSFQPRAANRCAPFGSTRFAVRLRI